MRKLLLGLCLCIPVQVYAYSGYKYQSIVTFSKSAVYAEDLSDFPILLSTTSVPLKTVANGGHVETGYDIVFSTKSDCSYLLKWDTETYNASTGEFVTWVKLPTVSSSTDSTFYMCYGKASITTYQGDSTHTWDSNFVGVWHLGDGSTLSTYDSTGNGHTLTNQGASATTGVVASGAANVTGDNQRLQLEVAFGTGTSNGYTGIGSTGTITFVRSNTAVVNSKWGMQQLSVGGSNVLGMLTASGAFRLYFNNSYIVLGRVANEVNPISIAFDNTNVMVHSTGAAAGVGTMPSPIYNSDMSLNAPGSWNGASMLTGGYDEVRVSNVKRSQGWLATQANVLRSLALPVMAVETTETSNTRVFLYFSKNIDLDYNSNEYQRIYQRT